MKNWGYKRGIYRQTVGNEADQTESLLFEDKCGVRPTVEERKHCDSDVIANLEHEVDLPHPKATHKAEGTSF